MPIARSFRMPFPTSYSARFSTSLRRCRVGLLGLTFRLGRPFCRRVARRASRRVAASAGRVARRSAELLTSWSVTWTTGEEKNESDSPSCSLLLIPFLAIAPSHAWAITPKAKGHYMAVLELSESSLELSFLGGEYDDESRPVGERFMLGECEGEVLLISEEHGGTVVYRVFRWVPGEGKWVTITSLGARALFLGFNGFAACVGPDYPGIRGDCIYAAGRRLGEWYEYSLVNGTCDVCYAEYAGAPPLNNNSPIRPLVWVFPSLV